MGEDRVDLLVVGGGIVGLAIAWEAARRGRRVCVVERTRPGSGATAVAGGMIAPGCESDIVERPLTRLGLDSAAQYPAWIAALEAESGLTCGYRTFGTLLVALHRDHEAVLGRMAAIQRELGLAIEPLTAAQLRAREPDLAPRVVGGWWVPGDQQVDPRRVAAALAEAIVRRGGRLLWPARVRSLAAGRAEIELEGGAPSVAVEAREVVLAAGAWSPEALPGLPPLPLRPVRGEMLRLRGAPLLRHVTRTPEVYLVPREDGELLVGSTMEERGFDATPRTGAVLDLLREAWRVLPGVAELGFESAAAGFRPALRDRMPAIGPAPAAGLWLAVGHHRHGVLLAPATARGLLDMMDQGEAPALLRPFSPARLWEAP